MNWGEVSKPGGGSSAKDIDFFDPDHGYIVDTNAKVYETTDGGSSWNVIGIDGGSVGLYGVAAVARDDINVTGGDGSVFRYNGAVWTKNYAGKNALYGIDRKGSAGLASGNGGTIYQLTRRGWKPAKTPVSKTLHNVALGRNGAPDVAVETSGTIIERGTSSLEPIGDSSNPPNDLDGDGLYEDITGDGSFGEDDAQALYDNLNSGAIQDNAESFDFNGDGKVDVTDVQKLYDMAKNQ